MKKYKLAQKCDELVKPTREDGSSKRAEVCRQRVIAIASPVDALGKLQHKDTGAKIRGGRMQSSLKKL